MFYCINPKFKYQFFSPNPQPEVPPEPANPTPINDRPTDEPSKRNLVGALKALYVAYGGEEEVSNNIVDIIYKIANVINEKNNISGGIAQQQQQIINL